MANGFLQEFGVNYSKNLSCIKTITIRIMLTLAISKWWKVRQIDVNDTFLSDDLLEDV